MNPDPHHYFLLSAYAATWAIYGTYLYILVRKAKRVRKEIERVKRSG